MAGYRPSVIDDPSTTCKEGRHRREGSAQRGRIRPSSRLWAAIPRIVSRHDPLQAQHAAAVAVGAQTSHTAKFREPPQAEAER